MGFSSGLVGTLQKTGEFVEYWLHRSKLKLDFHRNRRAHRQVFNGVIGRILIVRFGSLGDIVRSTAVVRELRTQYPSATIDYLTSAASRPILARNPDLNTIYVLADLKELGAYDWVINLQNPTPIDGFLDGSGGTYRDVLAHLSERVQARFISGRHLEGGREVSPTDIHFCQTEFEELFRTALLDYDARRYPRTWIHLDEAKRQQAWEKFNLPAGRPIMGLFLGTNSVGCGADEGYRAYSMPQLVRIAEHFLPRFTVAVFGQGRMRNADELAVYRDMLRRHPEIIDLVDRTSLDELTSLIDRFAVVVTGDSSPIHLAMARGVPVVGLYVSDATFKMSPALEGDAYVALNSAAPCFKYSKRWKYFCVSCREPAERARYCHTFQFVFGVDRIPIERIDGAVTRLLARREAACRT